MVKQKDRDSLPGNSGPNGDFPGLSGGRRVKSSDASGSAANSSGATDRYPDRGEQGEGPAAGHAPGEQRPKQGAGSKGD